MEEKRKTHKLYCPEFKEEAVARCEKNGATQTSRELGIPQVNLNRWKHELKGRVKDELSKQIPSYEELENEVRRLRKAEYFREFHCTPSGLDDLG